MDGNAKDTSWMAGGVGSGGSAESKCQVNGVWTFGSLIPTSQHSVRGQSTMCNKRGCSTHGKHLLYKVQLRWHEP